MKLSREQIDFINDNETVFFAPAGAAGTPRVIPVDVRDLFRGELLSLASKMRPKQPKGRKR